MVATFPDVPLDANVEIYYSGAWHTIPSAKVLIRDGMKITRGTPNESTRIDNSYLNFSINNKNGDYSPRNPRSPLFGLIGRNTPLRFALNGFDVTADSFNRYVTSGWGVSEYNGESWNFNGSGGAVAVTDTSIISTGAQMSVPAATAFRFNYLAGVSLADVAVTVRTRWLDTAGGFDVLGNDVEGGLMLRVQNISTYYHPRLEYNADQTLTASIHAIGGTGSIGSATVPAITYTGQWLRVKGQCIGSTIRMKVWADGTAEPAAWTLSVTDTQITAAGGIGVRSGVATGNTNTGRVFYYSDFMTDHSHRFSGEVVAWPQKWTRGGKDVWVPIKVAGIKRRLGIPSGQAAAKSALVGTIMSAAAILPVAYYPLNEPATATQLGNAVAPATLGTVVTTTRLGDGGELVGEATLLGFTPDQTNSSNAFSLPQTNVLLPIGAHTNTGTYAITFWHRFILPHPTDGPTRNYHESINNALAINPAQDPTLQDQTSVFHRVDFAGGTVKHVDFRMQETANVGGVDHVYLNIRNSANTYIGGPDGFVAGLSDGGWHEIQATMVQSGGNIISNLYVDGVAVGTTSTFAATMGTATAFGAGAYGGVIHPWIPAFQDETWAAYGLAHVSVHTSLVGQFRRAGLGYVGESAAERIDRLCRERGVALSLIGTIGALGSADGSKRVGVQRLAPFLDLAQDAADADRGLLYEPRGFLGLAYRTRRSLYNQAPTVALSYDGDGHVAWPLDPVDDDDLLANDITVSRYGGASARAVKATGTLNVQDPSADPDGVGPYPKSVELVLYRDDQCLNVASWLRHLGTWDEARYPVVNINVAFLAAKAGPALAGQALSLEIGHRFSIDNLPTWLPPEQLQQHSIGFTETFNGLQLDIEVNATPALPYEVFTVQTGSGNRSRIPAGVSTIAKVALSAVDTSMNVFSPNQVWINSTSYAAMFPFDLFIRGERMRVSAINDFATDLFTRTVAAGWGTTTTGAQAWTLGSGTAADFSVNGTKGLQSHSAVNATHNIMLASLGLIDMDVLIDLDISLVTPTGADATSFIDIRYVDANNHYRLNMTRKTTNVVTIDIVRVLAGVSTTLAGPVVVPFAIAGSNISIRFQVSGSQVRAKAWRILSQSEPEYWLLSATDSAPGALAGVSGGLRVSSFLNPGNTNALPVVFHHDFLAVKPQVFTVTRGINGIAKTHAVGEPVQLLNPPVIAL